MVDQKIKKFVPYFNLIYPFATLIENQYFERKREQERRERQEEERQEREREEEQGDTLRELFLVNE